MEGYLASIRVERGLSKNTLLAYQSDLLRLATWATRKGLTSPTAVGHTDLATYMAALHREGLDRRSMARHKAEGGDGGCSSSTRGKEADPKPEDQAGWGALQLGRPATTCVFRGWVLLPGLRRAIGAEVRSR